MCARLRTAFILLAIAPTLGCIIDHPSTFDGEQDSVEADLGSDAEPDMGPSVAEPVPCALPAMVCGDGAPVHARGWSDGSGGRTLTLDDPTPPSVDGHVARELCMTVEDAPTADIWGGWHKRERNYYPDGTLRVAVLAGLETVAADAPNALVVYLRCAPNAVYAYERLARYVDGDLVVEVIDEWPDMRP